MERIDSPYMTVAQVAKSMGVSKSAIKRVVAKLFPGLMVNGKATRLNEKQVAAISKEMKGDYHLSQLTCSAGEQVMSTTTEEEIVANYRAATEALVAMLAAKNRVLEDENDKLSGALEERSNYVAVEVYMRRNNIPCLAIADGGKGASYSAVGQRVARFVRRHPEMRHLVGRKVPMGKYDMATYHVDLLRAFFEEEE